MRIFKKRTLILAAIVIVLAVPSLLLFQLTDLRPEHLVYPNDQEKARGLLEQMGRAHGIDNWEGIKAYKVGFDEEFYGFLGKATDPFKERSSDLELRYIPGIPSGRLSYGILGGETITWGFDRGTTYRLNSENKFVAEDHDEMRFWIPTYQYFIEFPKKILEANIVDYAGTSTINGKPVEGVLASWGSLEPQVDIDQYLIWLDAETHRIVKVEYTVRDMYRFVRGAAFFNAYQEFNGLLLPTQMPVESNLVQKGYLHKMSLKHFQKIDAL